jgi:DNA-binding transcriptional regulator LsrR (DeoR family)
MMRGSHDDAALKADRALELYERGISRSIIAERLGVRPSHISGMLQRARQRREKAKEGVE